MSDTKFRVGDRVRHYSGMKGIVTALLDKDVICVKHPTENVGTTWRVSDCRLDPSDDPKTAFLTELKALLEKYDAEFGDYEGYRIHFKIGNEYIGWDTVESDVTPENIFDYD